MGDGLLDPREAAQAAIARAPAPRLETVPLERALGRVLAADVASRDDVPGFDNSAMDGFARARRGHGERDAGAAGVCLRSWASRGRGSPSGAALEPERRW